MTTLSNYYTMPEAAERLHVHSNSVRRTLARLGIETVKFHGRWVVLKSEVDAVGEYVPNKKPKSVHKRPYLIHPDSPQRQRPVHTPE